MPLTAEIAEALYVGLVTDTGRFQYTNTTPKALRLAAELVEAGADVHGVFRHVYETVQFAKLKLLARALERAQLFEGGRLVVSYLLKDDFAAVGAEEPYSEGIIDSLRAVEDSEMVALIREPPRERRPAAPHLAALEPRRGRRLGDRAQGRRRRPPPGRRASRPSCRSRRSSSSCGASSSVATAAEAGAECRRERLSLSGSRCSTSPPGRRRSRSSRRCAGARWRAPVTPGR